MRLSTMLVLGLAANAMAQAPKLDPAQAVDIRVQTVQWHPHGDALLYSRAEGTDRVGIGLFRLDQPEGAVLLHLAKADKWDAEWFEGSSNALIQVKKKVRTAQGEGTECDIYLLNGERQTAAIVFSRTVLAPDQIAVETDLSPLLTHAVLTVHEGKKTYHAVLPISGGTAVASPDIDEAEREGYAGPSWSQTGTAIYGKEGGAIFRANGASIDVSALVSQIELKVASQDLGTDATFVLRLSPPAPAAGTPVLEVVPSNGVLRQVLSPGPWAEPSLPTSAVGSVVQQTTIQFKRMQGSSQSLWLVRRKPEPSEPGGVSARTLTVENGAFRIVSDGSGQANAQVGEDTTGVLVAANAQTAWLTDDGRAIAYTVDGALFVRRVKP